MRHTRLYRDGVLEAKDFPAAQISDYLQEPGTVVWLDLCEPNRTDLEVISQEFGLHPLAVEDAIQEHERPKLDRYQDHAFLTAYAVSLDPATGRLTTSELAAFATPRALITVRKDPRFDIDGVVARWDGSADLAGHGVGFLLWGLLDFVVDGHFATVQRLDEAMEGLEDLLFDVVSGFSTLVGLASGLILGALIMYYLLKDGTRLRRSVVAAVDPRLADELDDFLSDSCRTLRDYGRGRTVMSVIVSAVIGLAALLLGLPLVFSIMVVNFIGGYIPYIGAFLGGGLAVIIALGNGGLGTGAVMLVIVLAANLLLENFVEPKVMGRTLDIHPLVVLVVTALGGLLGGIVGLILAVPATEIASNGIARLRSRGSLARVAERAQPTVRRIQLRSSGRARGLGQVARR